jgi:hypothetical protein
VGVHESLHVGLVSRGSGAEFAEEVDLAGVELGGESISITLSAGNLLVQLRLQRCDSLSVSRLEFRNMSVTFLVYRV